MARTWTLRRLTYEILVDRSENPRKCTIQPLADRGDFLMRRFSRGRVIAPLSADLLLHIEGAPLDEMRSDGTLSSIDSVAVVDCHWKRCAAIMAQLQKPWPTLARIPNGFLTAYPRKNLAGQDPEGGLATIEALFIAAAFMGRWDETLLAKYHFSAKFLAANAPQWERFGLR